MYICYSFHAHKLLFALFNCCSTTHQYKQKDELLHVWNQFIDLFLTSMVKQASGTSDNKLQLVSESKPLYRTVCNKGGVTEDKYSETQPLYRTVCNKGNASGEKYSETQPQYCIEIHQSYTATRIS